MRGVPEHCTTKDEWPYYAVVALQKWEIHAPDLSDAATMYKAYAKRVGYLEGVCKGVNSYRDE